MFRSLGFACVALCFAVSPHLTQAAVKGNYLEARTCQVYTGPCFANGEIGLTGKDAVMAWNVSEGEHQGVDLAGLSVVVVIRASHTLGFSGLDDPEIARCMLVVDENATPPQRDALIDFATHQVGKAGQDVVRVASAPIRMDLDLTQLTAKLQAGDCVQLLTRAARPGDCICSNEVAYYPPLAKVENFVAGVTVDGSVTARSLGTRWSIPDTRTAYMATFAYE